MLGIGLSLTTRRGGGGITPGVIAAGAGAFALTGQSASLRAARQFPASAGSFALTGVAAGLTYGALAPPDTLTTLFPHATFPAGLTVSGGGLTVTSQSTGQWITGHADTSHNTGKRYFEAVATGTGSGIILGVSVLGQDPALYLGGSADGAGAFDQGYFVYVVTFGTFTGYSAGARLGLAFDITAKKAWCRVNGGAWQGTGDPAAGTGGYDLSGMSGFTLFPTFSGNAGAVATFNFATTGMVDAIPAGFLAWNA